MNALSSALVLSLTLPVAASAGTVGQKLDAEVTTSSGDKVRLKDYYGKPVLLFYEDPDSVKLNQPTKDELLKLSLKWGLAEKIDVVAVANLQGLNWQPAIFFALMAVRSEEKKARIPVLVDFAGNMERSPWKLSSKSSSILVLAPDGEVLFESVGLMKKDKFAEMVSTLERLLTATAQQPAEQPAAEALAVNR